MNRPGKRVDDGQVLSAVERETFELERDFKFGMKMFCILVTVVSLLIKEFAIRKKTVSDNSTTQREDSGQITEGDVVEVHTYIAALIRYSVERRRRIKRTNSIVDNSGHSSKVGHFGPKVFANCLQAAQALSAVERDLTFGSKRFAY